MPAISPPPTGATPSIREMTNARREGRVWHGPDSVGLGRPRFSWKRLLWQMVYPPRDQRVSPTLSGTVLIGFSLGIGFAAYNTSNNILFITLSLLLSCLLLSGLLSWMNLAKVAWRLRIEPVLRVGVETLVALEVRNRKRVLPTYGLSFEIRAGANAREPVVLALRERLDPAGGRARLEWVWRPEQRGAVPVELASVASLFPFGFLKKRFPGGLRRDVIVWPAPVTYRRFTVESQSRAPDGRRLARVGQGEDLHALRSYARGDSYRLIHWKASARAGQLLVRQFAAESEEGFSLRLDPAAEHWFRAEQFELLLRFAASLAEDLFRAGRLESVAIGNRPGKAVRRLSDVEAFLDELAVLQPRPAGIPEAEGEGGAAEPRRSRGGRRNLLTFAPDGLRGVAAFLDDQKAAAT